jgi:hypothetical protein
MTTGAKNEQPKRERNPQAGNERSKLRSYERSRGSFSWDNIPQEKIARLVKAACGQGCGLVLGVTSDGGALSITLLDGDERIREWPSDNAGFDKFLSWLEASN